MTERGLPIVDGPVACPFVAFDDDRDERSTSPDHRHRCYAEATPAPRALAHQEAYCLASAFPVCPTFQDWARREAAKAIPDATTAGQAIPGLSDERPSGDPDEAEPLYEDRPRRSSQRDWAAPPPWMAGAGGERGVPGAGDDEDLDIGGGYGAGAAPAGGPGAGASGAAAGLSGSFADRLAGPAAASHERTPVWREPDHWDDEPVADAPAAHGPNDDAGGAAAAATGAAAGIAAAELAASRRMRSPDRAELEEMPPRREREPDRERAGAVPRDRSDTGRPEVGPAWERPARLEAFPALRAQRMPSLKVSSLALAAVAIVLAAVLLFFLPGLFGLGSGQPGASPTPTVAVSLPAASVEPTVAPEPTEQVYIAQAGDTMSKIATRFHIPLQVLIDANKTTIPNPNKLKVNDRVIIPVVGPSSVPASSP